jgi:hypothetical protein
MAIASGILGVVSLLASAKQARVAGEIKQAESETESKQIETAAAQREADRKDRLARAVASQSASAGASGIEFQGSPLTVLEEDMRREDVATERDVLQTRVGAAASRLRGSVARSQGRAQSNLLLFQGASRVAGTFS